MSREMLVVEARMFIAQARHFRQRRNGSSVFALTLLEWAGNCRREASRLNQTKQAEYVLPTQGELF